MPASCIFSPQSKKVTSPLQWQSCLYSTSRRWNFITKPSNCTCPWLRRRQWIRCQSQMPANFTARSYATYQKWKLYNSHFVVVHTAGKCDSDGIFCFCFLHRCALHPFFFLIVWMAQFKFYFLFFKSAWVFFFSNLYFQCNLILIIKTCSVNLVVNFKMYGPARPPTDLFYLSTCS